MRYAGVYRSIDLLARPKIRHLYSNRTSPTLISNSPLFQSSIHAHASHRIIYFSIPISGGGRNIISIFVYNLKCYRKTYSV